MAMTVSAAPERKALYALINALPPVAQPLATLMNGTPVRPRSETSVSAAPAADEPPNAYSTSDQVIAASCRARRAATAPCSRPVIGWRPKACIPIPTMATSS
jgi:hypothetical protein